MPSTIVALTIGAIIIQQLLVLVRAAFSWATLTGAERQDFGVKLVGLALGIVFAAVTGLNIIPDGALPNVITPAVLVGLSGVALGFGIDVAVGLVKLGTVVTQTVKARAEAVIAKAEAQSAGYAAHG